jgi:hypothetical protein
VFVGVVVCMSSAHLQRCNFVEVTLVVKLLRAHDGCLGTGRR